MVEMNLVPVEMLTAPAALKMADFAGSAAALSGVRHSGRERWTLSRMPNDSSPTSTVQKKKKEDEEKTKQYSGISVIRPSRDS